MRSRKWTLPTAGLGVVLAILSLAACTQPIPTAAPAREPQPTVQAVQQTEMTPPLPQATEFVQEWSSALPSHLLGIEPAEGKPVRIEFRACATFDITQEGMGQEWRGPVSFEFGEADLDREFINVVNDRFDPSEGTACTPSLRFLLGQESLNNLLPLTAGPLDLAVRYQTSSGDEYRYAWQVQLQLAAPTAPPEVHRVREAYDLFLRVMEQAGDNVADHFLDLSSEVLYVYLTSSGEPDPVQSVVEEVFGSNLPEGGVRLVRPDYDVDRLPGWYRQAQDVVWPVGRVWFSDHDELRDRIEFGVQTEYAAYRARKALAGTDVPQEAVVIEVSPKNNLADPPTQPDSPIGVAISLDFPATVHPGQAVPIEVVLTNQGESQANFEYNPHHPMNICVFTDGGDQVWAKRRGGVITLPARNAVLAPGEELRFKAYWDVTDQDGFALPSGRYLVRGTSNIHDFVEGRVRLMDLATGPYELVVEPAGATTEGN